MAHNIAELADGVHAFATAREHAWHRLGTVLDETMTAEQALKAAHLADWDVRKVSLTAHEGDITIGVNDRWATVYTNPVDGSVHYLGVVGSTYTPIQNEEHAGLLNAIVDESGAHFETAGALRDGKQTFMTMRLPESMLVGGHDVVDQYLVATNSHDGSSSFQFVVSPIRVVCANTLTAAIEGAQSTFRVRHVKGATGAIQEAREALGLTWKYLATFEQEAERMIAKSLTDATFEKMVASIFGSADAKTKRAENTAAEHVAGVMGIWRSESPTIVGVKGTRWGGYQAVTEYIDHYMTVRGDGDKVDARAKRTLISKPIERTKSLAFATLAKGA